MSALLIVIEVNYSTMV